MIHYQIVREDILNCTLNVLAHDDNPHVIEDLE